jgi:hypothetical protein
MHSTMSVRIVRALLTIIVAGCSGASGSPNTTGSTATTGPTAASTAAPASTPGPGSSGAALGTPGAGGQPGVVQGSVVTSAPYPATWTFVVGNNSVRRDGLVGLTSDQGTPGKGPETDMQVDPTGAISFGSVTPGQDGMEPPEVMAQIFNGTGGHPDVRADSNGNTYVCGFTLDNDVAPASGSPILHIKGTIKIIGTMDTVLGPIDC